MRQKQATGKEGQGSTLCSLGRKGGTSCLFSVHLRSKGSRGGEKEHLPDAPCRPPGNALAWPACLNTPHQDGTHPTGLDPGAASQGPPSLKQGTPTCFGEFRSP